MNESPRCSKCGTQLPADAPGGLCPKCLVQAGFESQPASADPGPTKLTPPNSGFVPPAVEELAKCFPQLEVLELLGKGGMGAVYKARQTGLDRLVAIKILPPEISHDPAFAERFQREARALARLSHPHIVTVYDFGETAGLYYIVMEFVDGANLRQTIRTGKLAAAEALAIVPQICEALQFAHDEGIVHRDIKPENILIDKRGRVKIADFGLAKLLGQDASDHSLTATHQVMGTLRYMAPEQMQGSREVDHRADIYSLGVVFYELLTGELPMGKFAPPSKKVQVDVRLDEIVLRALEQEPEQRYQHASEVKTDVETISRSPSVARSEFAKGVATPAQPEPTAEPQVYSGETYFVVVLSVLALVGLAMWFGQSAWWLLALLVPEAMIVALTRPDELRTLGSRLRLLIVVLAILGLIGFGMWLEQSPWPLLALAIFSVPIVATSVKDEDETTGNETTGTSSVSLIPVATRTSPLPAAARWWLLPRTVTLLAALVGGLLVSGPWQSVEIRAPFTQGSHIQWFLSMGYESGLGLAAGVLFAITFFMTLAAFPLRRAAVPATTILLGLLITALMTSYGYHPPLMDRPEVADAVVKIHALNPNLPAAGATDLEVVQAAREARFLEYWQRIIPAFYVCLAMALVTVLTATFDFVLLRQAAAVEPSHEKAGEKSGEPEGVSSRTGDELVRGLTASGSPSLTPDRPPLVLVFAALDLIAAVLLMLLFTAGDHVLVPATVSWLWHAWGISEIVLGLLGSVGLLTASIALFLWKPWARKLMLGVCFFGLVALAIDLPYVAQMVIPAAFEEARQAEIAKGNNSVDADRVASLGLTIGFGGLFVLGLSWLIGHFVYFTRPRVIAAFDSRRERQGKFIEWLFTGTGAVVGVLSVFGPLALLLGISWLLGDRGTSKDSLGRLVVEVDDFALRLEIFRTGEPNSKIHLPASGVRERYNSPVPKGNYNVVGYRHENATHHARLDVAPGQTRSVRFTQDNVWLGQDGMWTPPPTAQEVPKDSTADHAGSVAHSAKVELAESPLKIEEHLTLKGHTGYVYNVRFSPDGKRIASASHDETAKIWDAETGDELVTCRGHTDYVHGLAYNSDGTRLATSSQDGSVRIWDAATGEEKLHVADRGASNLAFSPNGERIASAGNQNNVLVWNSQTGEEILTLKGDERSAFFNVAYSPDGNWIAASGMDGALWLWDAATGREADVHRNAISNMRGLAFDRESKRIAACTMDGLVRVWDVLTGELLFFVTLKDDSPWSVSFSSDGKWLANGTTNGDIRIWHATKEAPVYVPPARYREALTLKAHPRIVKSVVFNHDGTRLASGSDDKSVKVWRVTPNDGRTNAAANEAPPH